MIAAHLLSMGVAGARTRRQPGTQRHMKAIGITAALAVLPTLLKGRPAWVSFSADGVIAHAIYRENVKPGRPCG